MERSCSREDLDSKVSQSMEKTNRKLYTLLTRMTDMKEQYELSRFEELDKGVEEIWQGLEATNQKLNNLLAILTDVKKDPPKV